MGREENSLLLAKVLDELSDFKFLVGVETVGRFVENQNLGVVKEGLRKTSPVAVSFGECSDRLTGHAFEKASLDRSSRLLRAVSIPQDLALRRKTSGSPARTYRYKEVPIREGSRFYA